MKEVELARERERVESCRLLCHTICIASCNGFEWQQLGGSKYQSIKQSNNPTIDQ